MEKLNIENFNKFKRIFFNRIQKGQNPFIFIEKGRDKTDKILKLLDIAASGYIISNIQEFNFNCFKGYYNPDIEDIIKYINNNIQLIKGIERNNYLIISHDRIFHMNNRTDNKIISFLELIHTRRSHNLNIILIGRKYEYVLKNIRECFDIIFYKNDRVIGGQ